MRNPSLPKELQDAVEAAAARAVKRAQVFRVNGREYAGVVEIVAGPGIEARVIETAQGRKIELSAKG